MSSLNISRELANWKIQTLYLQIYSGHSEELNLANSFNI